MAGHSRPVQRRRPEAGDVLADSGTITLTGGSSPAANTTLTGVSSNEDRVLIAFVGVDTPPSFNADYAFNFDYTTAWDDTAGEWDVTLTVNWDTDPGTNNDVTAAYRIYEEGL